MIKRLTKKEYLKLLQFNSKDHPAKIDKYSKKSVLTCRLRYSRKTIPFYIQFTCKDCLEKTLKNMNHYNKTYIEFITYCPNCIRKLTTLEKYGCENVSQSTKIKKKKETTCKKHYGVKNPMQSRRIHNKAKKTNLQRYGCENVFQNKQIKEKIKQTHLENLGVEYPMQSEEIQEKSKQTCKEQYGVEHYSQSEECKKKVQKTSLKHFGVTNPNKNKKVRNKIKRTCIKRYGHEYATQNEEVKDKMRKTKIERYGTLHHEHHYQIDSLSFDSSWEVAFYLYHRDKGHNIQRESTYFEYYVNKTKCLYFPDFKIGSRYYEIKGDQFIVRDSKNNIIGLKDLFSKRITKHSMAKYKCMLDHNVKIITSYEITKYLDYLYENYDIKQFMIGDNEND